MSDFQEFLENSLQQKIKQLIPLTGGASADINRIVLANEDELIVRRTLSQEKSVMAIPKILEAKILVVGNPANTNALIGCTYGNNDSQTWMAMTALDANRAKAQIANKCNLEISDIKKMTIWGNHSPTMYPDLDNAEIKGESASGWINDQNWIESDFLRIVQQRGKAIIDARGA
ncbi:hypothetical protein OA078_02790, partial [Gammaproteobacteria bacterium]|nr:hypothetical protein [Gammaproteobacteria bacterium]